MSNSRFLVERYYREKWNDEELTYREILRKLYVDRDMSIRNISDEIGLSVGSVHKDIKEFGITKVIRCKK